jgi:hypothetical protein
MAYLLQTKWPGKWAVFMALGLAKLLQIKRPVKRAVFMAFGSDYPDDIVAGKRPEKRVSLVDLVSD